MYGFSEYIPLDMVEILKRVSQYEIVEQLIPGTKPIVLDERITSPLRPDNTPKCYFTWYDNKLKFVDFAKYNRSMDCFDMIQRLYGVSLYGALVMINNHFKLGLGTNSPVQKIAPVIYTESDLKLLRKDKSFFEIDFKPRPFDDKSDKKYWSRFQISKNNLDEDGVYAVIWYKFFSHKINKSIVIRPIDICYAYTEFTGKLKIYRPLSNNPKGKWLTNCGENDIGNIGNISERGEKLIITKSYKDCRVLRNQGIKDVIWFQNEGMIPKEEIMLDLIQRFERIIILFDNDEAGLLASSKVVEYINNLITGKAKSVFIPQFTGIKDPADLIDKKGREELMKFINTEQLL